MMLPNRQPHRGLNTLDGLSGRGLPFALGALAVAAALIQLALGAPLAVVVLVLITVATGLFGFVALGANTLGSWVALFYALGNAIVALYAKTLMGQTIDSHLEAADYSFLAIAITASALVAALLLVRLVPVGRPLFHGIADPKGLAFLSWSCFGLGAMFWLLNRWFQDPSGSGFGGIALFRDLPVMAVIARTAMLIERSGGRREFDGRLFILVTASVAMGLIDNSKTVAALPALGHILTVLFYRGRLPIRTIVVFTGGAFLFIGVIAPMIHALRASGQQDLSVGQRIELVTSTATGLVQAPWELRDMRLLADEQFGDFYFNYFGGNGAGQMLLGRYASVQQIDPVIAAVNRQGPQGGAAIWPALARLVPRFIKPNKPEYIEAYYTVVHYGLIDSAGGKFPAFPLAGQSYAAYGMVGLILIPLPTFVLFLLVAKKWGWCLHRNIYAIFFLAEFVVVYVSQGDFGHYTGAALRNFPLFAVTFWIVDKFFRTQRSLHHIARRAAPVA